MHNVYLRHVAPIMSRLRLHDHGLQYRSMSKLLDHAIQKVREFPEKDQDIAAAELLGVLADFPTSDERASIASGPAQFERGDFITHEQWRHEMGLGDR